MADIRFLDAEKGEKEFGAEHLLCETLAILFLCATKMNLKEMRLTVWDRTDE
jgi:hypothetical protein